MKKTLIALLALSSLAMGEDVAISQLWDFNSNSLPGDNKVKTITVTDANKLVSATITSTVNFYAGSWDTTETYYSNNITGLDDKIGIDGVEAAAETYISASQNITLTLSGLTAGNEYEIALITGYDSSATGGWGSVNSSNEEKGTITWINNPGTTDNPNTWGSQSIQRNQPTGVYIEGIVADDDGTINLSINKNFHSLGISALAITGTVVTADPTPGVPEPTTATLSLLALAGLAARRRRK